MLADNTNNNALLNGYILNNKYKIVKKLGEGGFGITYLAEELTLNKRVAIKEFMPREHANRSQINMAILPYTDKIDGYNYLIIKFEEEARLLVDLNHPNIVRVWELIKTLNTVYIVMEYEEGEDLKHYLQKHQKLSEYEIIKIIIPILEAIKFIHIRGILHRDIAPDNIYMRSDGTPIVIDFGSARDVMAQYSKNISSIVKDGYSPPEQYTTANTNQSPPTDIYALGAVLYEMMSGKKPISSQARQHTLYSGAKDPLENLSLICKNKYSQNLINIVNKAMNIKMQDRFQSVGDMQNSIFLKSKSSFPFLKVIGIILTVFLFIIIALITIGSSSEDDNTTIETNSTIDIDIANKDFDMANKYYEIKDYPKAVESYQKACDNGNMKSCNNLGFMYSEGNGIKQDKLKAVGLFNKVCENNIGVGCYSLGVMYEQGKELEKNLPKSIELYEKACDANYTKGCNELGLIYDEGKKVTQDYFMAFKFYQKACDANDAIGCYNLAVMYENGKWIAKDKAQASKFYKKACDNGIKEGCTKYSNN